MTIDTIVAPGTPLGRSALAVVRIDGPESLRMAQRLSGRQLPERSPVLASLTHQGELIDEAVVTWFASPRSYTGNDLIEISLHGNPLLVRRLIEALTALGARSAEPGEFTERAVLNGKLDLVQAESVAGLIAARTSLQARLSLENLGGRLTEVANELREALLFVRSRLEAALDFADEGYEFISRSEADETIAVAEERCRELVRSFERGRAVSDGLTAVIAGRPNAGKSTLLNYLVGSERAIVTAEPGTTRDLLRETVEIGGLPVTFVDTAGLRETVDEIERIGIGRAREAAANADLVIYLIDAAAGLTARDEEELGRIRDPLVVYTKIDLAPAPPNEGGISIPTGQGLADLMAQLDQEVRSRFVPPEESATIVNERQRRACLEAMDAMAGARGALSEGATEEIVAAELMRASEALAALVGGMSAEELMGEIFSKFCIGK